MPLRNLPAYHTAIEEESLLTQGPVADPYQLPLTKIHQSCRVGRRTWCRNGGLQNVMGQGGDRGLVVE